MIVGGRRSSREEAKLNRKLDALERQFSREVHRAEFKLEKARAKAIKSFEKRESK
jgi:hypothetical protein